jgi:16S rRNA (guanine527-N7)-methyltransferase
MDPLLNLRPALLAGLDSLGLPAETAPRLLEYLALLNHWNRTYNLTAIREPSQMLVKHLFDSLAVVAHVPPGRLADLGTGPGLPGIPVAVVRDDVSVSLVESNGKKARFLREAVRRLELRNARVLESRAEDVKDGGYDAITARALDRLAGILAVGGHLLAPHGRLLAMKAARVDEEVAELPPGWRLESVAPLTVPGLDAERVLVIVARSA